MKKFLLFLLLSIQYMGGHVYSSNGYYMPAYGARYAGMGGTSLGMGGSLMDLQGNPALLAMMTGKRFELGVAPIMATMLYKDQAYNNKTDWSIFAPTPYLGYAGPLNDKINWGIAFYIVGGAGAKYEGIEYTIPGGGPAAKENTNAAAFILRLTPGMSYALTDKVALGFSLDISRCVFKNTITTTDPTGSVLYSKVAYKPKSATALGGNIGLSYKLSRQWMMSYAFTTGNTVDLEGDMRLSTSGGSIESNGKTSLKLPSRHSVGIAYTEGAWTVGSDFKWVGYKASSKSSTIKLDDAIVPTPGGMSNKLVNNMNYTNQWIWTAGAEYRRSELSYRFGFNYGKSPITQDGISPMNSQFAQLHLTAGVGWRVSHHVTLDGALEYAVKCTVKGKATTDWAIQHGIASDNNYSMTGSSWTPYLGITYHL